MRLRVLTCIAGGVVIAVAAGAEGAPDGPCACPQTSRGWLLFADSNPRTPDFWQEDEVVVEEIAICRHGIRFLFVADEGGNPYLMALVFANPVADTRLYRRSDWTRLCGEYTALRTALERFSDGALEGTDRLDFQGTPRGERPRIVQPWCRLALVWRDREIKLRAYLDVYMTMLP
jgi:hypothetical protein